MIDDDPRFVQSMVNEARIGGLLHHANIVDILECGQHDDHWFIAMEFVDGPTLAEVVRQCRDHGVLLPRFAILDLSLQICRGLQHAHGLEGSDGRPLNLVHRDLKPSNVILDRAGTAKILDFGIAKASSNLFATTPWSQIYVDGALIKSDRGLRKHPVDGGVHEVRLVCSALDNQEKVFRVRVDGDDVSLGCWDFDAGAACSRGN